MHRKTQTAIFSLAAIMTFRMLGLFMLLPVFTLYTDKIPAATPTLVGLALGIYGFTQACLQIPFGMFSDRIGRKPIIMVGLILLGVGSFIAAVSHSIYGMIIGRAIQGAGAIGSTVLATIADLTSDEERSKAMAFVGMMIGASFAIALIMGPAVNAWFHLKGIFWATLLFTGVGIILLYTAVPTPPRVLADPEIKPTAGYFTKVLRNKELLRLNLGIFSLHCILTALFIGIPIILTQTIKLTEHRQTYLYLTTLLFAFMIVIPLIILSEKRRKLKPFFLFSILLIVICQFSLFIFQQHALLTAIILLLFFTAFTFLETALPSLISKIAPLHHKGTAMGIYSSAQFLGIFAGSSLGGLIFQQFHLTGLFIFCSIVGLIWLTLAITMKPPLYLSTMTIKLEASQYQNLALFNQYLQKISGVSEISFSTSNKLIYLRFDTKMISTEELQKQIKEFRHEK